MADKSAALVPAKKKSKKMMMIGVVLVVAAGAYYFFFMGKSADAKDAAPKPGSVVSMDAMTLNLADGHYLKLGLALELAEGVDAKSFDPSHAADIAIGEFSNRAMGDISSAAARDKLKADYVAQLKKAYPSEIYDVYYKAFVMQ